MEEVCFIGAVIAFALSVCSLVACVTIFIRAGVPDAIRFLQHRPAKKSSSGSKAPARRRARGKGGKASAKVDASGDDSMTGPGFLPPRPNDGGTLPLDGEASSEDETDVLGASSEAPTDVLGEQDSESPTGLLGDTVDQESENPTGLLSETGSESPTGLLTTQDPEGDSENPTGLLGDEGESEENKPEKDAHDEDPLSVAQQDETTFRFILKQSELVVHTQETIA